MRNAEITVLAQALERLREVDKMLDATNAGVCLIHLAACIAALESRLLKARSAEHSTAASTAN
jgi:hypothetical protein